tara:strand:+ start:121 stop:1110 length:990 start_codon:yes stop_codon:yes gene_type:complete
MRAYEFLSEAGLSVGDLRKRDNLQLFMDMIGKGEPFVKAGESEPSVVLQSSDELMLKLQNNDIPYIFDTNDGKQIRLSGLQKTVAFGSSGSKKDTSERQEHGLINVVNASKGATIEQMGITIKSARSYEGMNSMGKEQYIDIFITDSEDKDHGISMKGPSSISIGAGGTAGLVSMFPDLVKKVYNRIENYLRNLELKDDDVVPHSSIPDLYFNIPENYVIELMRGNKAMGGPIEWVYQGSSDVKGEVVDGKLNLNGNFHTVENYVGEEADKFYFRMRKRDVAGEHTQIDYVTTGKFDLPILMKNEVDNRRNWRLVMTKGRPNKSILLDL